MDSHDSSSHHGSHHDQGAADKRFRGDADRLRRQDRIELMELPRVVALTLDGLAAESLLDVGTGTGLLAEAFAPHVEDLCGVDVNPDYLAIARRHLPSARFVEGKAESIPCPDLAFDVSILGHVLHEVDDPLTALKEAGRVTRLRVAILEWPLVEGPHGPPMHHRMKPELVEDLARKSGFSRIDTFPLTHMVLYRLEK